MTPLKWHVMVAFTFCVFMLISPVQRNDNKIGVALKDRLSKMSSDEKELVWVYFKDKGADINLKKNRAFQTLSGKTLKRRAKVRSSDNLVDERDIPVSQNYCKAIEENGIAIRNTSKWFNAVSAWATREQIEVLNNLDFVIKIDPVARFQKKKDIDESESVELTRVLNKKLSSGFDSLFYGYSYSQLKQINVPEMHQLGFFGQGVTIAVFDAGFNNLAHEAFDNMQIIAKWDFVNNDGGVGDSADMGEGSHGTNTLSVVGGFKQGKLIGPAYRAEYILAKTENTDSETPFEEDNWIAAMEWAEGLGADIISSSLGYINFDSSGALTYDKSVYNWTWMTGDSTRITKAANIGVGMGLVVVNSAGNEYANISHNTLGAPADGDSVIAVGAVDASGIRAVFSSVGPTTRGQIKPDVMAMGYAVSMASATNTTGYVLNPGTSFACPLTAGVCALMLSAHPGLTPAQVRWALKMTADNAGSPNNLYGYGIINALAASNYFGITGIPDTTNTPDQYFLYQNASNPFGDETFIKYDVAKAGNVRITVYNILGQQVKTLINRHHSVQSGYTVMWDGKDAQGNAVSSGMYFYRLEGNKFSKTKKMLLVR
ncbi:S8 family serine peptidase [bacterium]|nr:MAG: S8 family serine peptidase [bacterium]